MNDALIGLLGVALGSAVAIFGQWMTNRENNKRYEQEKRDHRRQERKLQLDNLRNRLIQCFKRISEMLDEEAYLVPDAFTIERQLELFKLETDLSLLIVPSGLPELKAIYEKLKQNNKPDEPVITSDLYKFSKQAIELVTKEILKLEDPNYIFTHIPPQ